MEGAPVVVNESSGGEELIHLPPGFRFHPTDEEIITHYLTPKVMNNWFAATAIGEVDLNKCEPWDLPKKAKMGEKEWFFFCQRDRKYPTGMRTNRATESGYWKATGKDKEIYRGKGCLVGMKKTLVFYRGRAPKGEKSNWVMHEYRLEGKFSNYNFPKASKDEWVVSRIFHKTTGVVRRSPNRDFVRMNSFVDELLETPSLPPLMDIPYSNNNGASCSRIPMNRPDHQEEFKSTAIPASQIQQHGVEEFHWNYLMGQANPNQNNYIFYPHQISNFPMFQRNSYGCKAEEPSINVSVSQDTGISTEVTAAATVEISSKQEMGGYGDLEDPSGCPISDLDTLWSY